MKDFMVTLWRLMLLEIVAFCRRIALWFGQLSIWAEWKYNQVTEAAQT